MNRTDETHADDRSIEFGRSAALRRAVMGADEADVFLLSGMSREDWLAQLDRAEAGSDQRPGPDAG